jgi:hypothetical protein
VAPRHQDFLLSNGHLIFHSNRTTSHTPRTNESLDSSLQKQLNSSAEQYYGHLFSHLAMASPQSLSIKQINLISPPVIESSQGPLIIAFQHHRTFAYRRSLPLTRICGHQPRFSDPSRLDGPKSIRPFRTPERPDLSATMFYAWPMSLTTPRALRCLLAALRTSYLPQNS